MPGSDGTLGIDVTLGCDGKMGCPRMMGLLGELGKFFRRMPGKAE